MDLKQCRLCLETTTNCSLIFSGKYHDSLAPLELKIAVCVSLSVTPQDPYTKFICKKCSTLIEKFYLFRETCMSNYLNLVGLDAAQTLEEETLTENEGGIDTWSKPASEPPQLEVYVLTNVSDNFEETILSQTNCEEELITDSHSENTIPNALIESSETNVESIVQHEDEASDSEISYVDYEAIIDPDAEYSSDSNVTSEGVLPSVGCEGDLSEGNQTDSQDGMTVLDVDPSQITVDVDPLGSADEVDPSGSGDVEEYIEEAHYDICVDDVNSTGIDSKDASNIRIIQMKRSIGASCVYRFICQNCNKIFSTPSSLRVHRESCVGVSPSQQAEQQVCLVVDPGDASPEEEPPPPVGRAKWGEKRRYGCLICSKAFKSSSMLHTHQRTHTGERPFACSLCPRAFSQTGALRNHEREHRNDWPYSCDICPKGFFRPSDLQKHMRTHTNERPFTCDVCSRGFHQQSGLVVHARIHSGERPYSCSICHMTFSQLSNKYRHMKTHAGGLKPFNCDLCHRKFADRQDLDMHREAHEGGKPRVCAHCGKAFRKAYELRDHMRRVHTNERPYVCQLCNKSFFVAHDLKSHLLVHTGERPFACRLCSQTFTQSGNLRRHNKRHHKDVAALADVQPSPMCVEAIMDVDNMNMLQFDASVE